MSRSDLYNLVRDLRQYLEWQAVPLTGATPASAEARAEFQARERARAEAKLRSAIAAPPSASLPSAPQAVPQATQSFESPSQEPATRSPEAPKGGNALWKSAAFGSRPKPTFETPATGTPAVPPTPTLEAIRTELGDCQRCGLSGARNSIVFGTGDVNARIMFVGAGPGANEDRQGEPFMGEAGDLLNKMISAMGLRREDVYLTSVVKCRAAGDPKPDEVAACAPFLTQQIAAVKPEVIVALGEFATRNLVGTKDPLTRLRGKWQTCEGIALMPTFHPEDLLQTPGHKRDAWADLKLVMAKLGITPPR